MLRERRLQTIKTTEKAFELLQIVSCGEKSFNINRLSKKLMISREEVLILLVARRIWSIGGIAARRVWIGILLRLLIRRHEPAEKIRKRVVLVKLEHLALIRQTGFRAHVHHGRPVLIDQFGEIGIVLRLRLADTAMRKKKGKG